MKDRHLEQAVKYSRALEEQGKASTRERELLRQVSHLGAVSVKTGSAHMILPQENYKVVFEVTALFVTHIT